MKPRGGVVFAICAGLMLGTAAAAQDRPQGSGPTGVGPADNDSAGRVPGTVSGSRIETRIPRYGAGLRGAFDPEADRAVGPGARSGEPAGAGPRGPRQPPSILD